MKRIVICCDGTWNSPAQENTTNVYKLSCAVPGKGADGVEQRVYYDIGVGAGSWVERIPGLFGSGVWRNVQRAYSFLAENYEANDEIYLFGFSRGAYTVRSVGGMVRKCGILRSDNLGALKEAYSFYRDRKTKPHEDAAKQFRRENSVEVGGDDPFNAAIRLIGVWDTVGALGVPPGLVSTPVQKLIEKLFNKGINFHDVALSRSVQNAYHALAIDELRSDYRAALWEQHPDATHQRLEQRWFAGVHTNVGGGAPDPGQSDRTLRWMIARAKACGLSFDDDYIGDNVSDRADAPLHKSLVHMFKLRPFARRPIGRGVPADEAVYLGGVSNETIDAAVLSRNLTDPSYMPPNLVEYYRAHPDALAAAKKELALEAKD